MTTISASVLDPATLGYLSGILGGVILLALVISLTVVLVLLLTIGGTRRSHVARIAESLEAVAQSTDPVPPTLTAINEELAELAQVLAAVEAHLAAARRLFELVSEAR